MCVSHFVIAMLMLSLNRQNRMVTLMWVEGVPGRQVTSIHTLSTVLSALQLPSPIDNFTDHKVCYKLSRLHIEPICLLKRLDEIKLDVEGFTGNPLRLCWSVKNSHRSVCDVGKLHI